MSYYNMKTITDKAFKNLKGINTLNMSYCNMIIILNYDYMIIILNYDYMIIIIIIYKYII